jgi:hypothetical protein
MERRERSRQPVQQVSGGRCLAIGAPALEAGPSSTHAAARMPQTRNLAPVAPVHCRCGQRWQKAGKPGSIAALEEWEQCKADGGIKRQAPQLAGYAADGRAFKRLRMPAPQRLSCWDSPASSEDTQSLDRCACSSPPSAVLQLCLCLRLHTARPRCTFLPPVSLLSLAGPTALLWQRPQLKQRRSCTAAALCPTVCRAWSAATPSMPPSGCRTREARARWQSW